MTVLKEEFFREIAVDVGGSGEGLMKKIRKSKNIEDKVKEKSRGRKRTGKRKMVSLHGKDMFMYQKTRTSGMK